jgi:hypothetical protein
MIRPRVHDEDPDRREPLALGNRGAEVVHPEDGAMGHFPFGIDGAGWDQHQIGDQAEVLSVGMGARSRVDHDEIDAARFLSFEERQ